MSNHPTTVALFVTCLVDLFRPEVGEATVALLERQGLRVEFPIAQTCCGAPAYHAGWHEEAGALARRWIEIFEPFEAIVSPSPACVAMVREAYPRLLGDDPSWRQRAEQVANRTYEVTEYLVQVVGVTDLGASYRGRITHQLSCQQLRALKTDSAVRSLLGAVKDAELVALPDAESCCGFGGLFSVQLPQISTAMGERKAKAIEASGAELVVCSEIGCVFQLAGVLSRRSASCRALHVAELLAGAAVQEKAG